MLAVYFVFLLSGFGDSFLIDQRQAGDFNVQVDVKDVQIFAVMKGEKEEYVVIYSKFPASIEFFINIGISKFKI